MKLTSAIVAETIHVLRSRHGLLWTGLLVMLLAGCDGGLYESFERHGIRLISPRHETSALHMAGAYARLTGDAIKGYMLVWPTGDDYRRQLVLTALEQSFEPLAGVLPDEVSGAHRIDLLAGLDIHAALREAIGEVHAFADHHAKRLFGAVQQFKGADAQHGAGVDPAGQPNEADRRHDEQADGEQDLPQRVPGGRIEPRAGRGGDCVEIHLPGLSLEGLFEVEERGEIEVKGKGRMTTYWLGPPVRDAS